MVHAKTIGVAVLCSGLLLSGCAAPPTQEQSGMVIGGVLGGALGSQVGGGRGRTAATVAVNGTIGGRKEKVYGTACRQADGSWRTASQ